MNGLCQNFEEVLKVSDLGFSEDAIEAQLIAYLAARFFENLPSSFPSTTGVNEPTIAGQLFLAE
ncbi:MAG: anhydro-N-acetylmuramic acid kinase, partial [Proteobacteria bacterium]|nr:anhydro-N-acetylmuramic acid kinase [Pseudomonadota bacterium]